MDLNNFQIYGELPCTLFPFFQTLSVLANSITLTVIALDRYMAIIRIVKGIWEPKQAFCNTCAVLIWGLAMGVSSPMIGMYKYIKVYLIPRPVNEEDLDNAELTNFPFIYICAHDKVGESFQNWSDDPNPINFRQRIQFCLVHSSCSSSCLFWSPSCGWIQWLLGRFGTGAIQLSNGSRRRWARRVSLLMPAPLDLMDQVRTLWAQMRARMWKIRLKRRQSAPQMFRPQS